jgi:hypothetical protein
MCLNQERRALAEEALGAPGDLELQEEVAREMGVVNSAYKAYALSMGVSRRLHGGAGPARCAPGPAGAGPPRPRAPGAAPSRPRPTPPTSSRPGAARPGPTPRARPRPRPRPCAKVVTATTLGTPLATAESMVQAYPYFPVSRAPWGWLWGAAGGVQGRSGAAQGAPARALSTPGGGKGARRPGASPPCGACAALGPPGRPRAFPAARATPDRPPPAAAPPQVTTGVLAATVKLAAEREAARPLRT